MASIFPRSVRRRRFMTSSAVQAITSIYNQLAIHNQLEKAMSHIFGKVIQTAYVVHDIEAVLRHWIENLGIGPWFYRELVPLDSFTYRGEPSDLKMSIALSYSGDMQFELIQPRNDAPSAYKDFLQTSGGGQHHLGFLADDLDCKCRAGTQSWISDGAGGLHHECRLLCLYVQRRNSWNHD